MKRKTKIWIIFNSRKGGHTYPSKALNDFINKKNIHSFSAQTINLLDFAPFVSLIDKLGRYGDLKLKSLYKRGYQNLQEENQTLLGGYRIIESLLFNMSKLHEKLVFRFGTPDIIISCQPEVNIIAHLFKKWFSVPVHTVIVDLAIHGLWVNRWIDHYYVANEPLKDELVQYRIDYKKISVTGMPLRNGFSKIVNSDMKKTRKQLKISADLPTILMMGGLLGTMIDFHEAIKSIMDIDSPFQLLVVFGKNEEGRLKAISLKERSRWPIHLFGAVSNVDEMMWASDIIVSKPGSVTMAEALSLGKPMIVITPHAGSFQELRFAKFLKDNGAGEWIDSANQVGTSLEKILKSKNEYKNMCKQAWEIGHYSLSATQSILNNIRRELQFGGLAKEEKQ